MIVDSMTHEEVYQELEREREAVTRWWRHQLEYYVPRVIEHFSLFKENDR